jgi:hypothetical protein
MKKSNSLFFYLKNVKVFSLLFILSVVLSLFFIIPTADCVISGYNVPITSIYAGSVLPNNLGAVAGMGCSTGINYSLLVATFYFQSATATLFNGKIGCMLTFSGNGSSIENSTTVYDFTTIALPRRGNDDISTSYVGYSFDFSGNSQLKIGTAYKIQFYVNVTASSGGYVMYAVENLASVGVWTPTTGAFSFCGSIVEQEPYPFEFLGLLSGDIFNNQHLAYSPIEITLKQGTSYTYTGFIYRNYILSGNGNFTVLTTDLSTSTDIFNTYIFTNKFNGSIVNGEFSFNLQPITSLRTVYKFIQVNFTLSDGIYESYYYNLGYYALGGGDENGLIPYPTDSGSGGVGGATDTIGFMVDFLSNWRYIAILIIYGVCCGLLTWKLAFTGLIAGLDIATVVCFVTGLLGGLMYPVLGLVIVANIALIITGSGLLNRTKLDGNN